MNKKFWRRLSNFMLGSFITALGLFVLVLLVGPSIGAPEGERTLGVEPFWLSRVSYFVSPEGVHEWTRETNLILVGFIASCLGVVAALVLPANEPERVAAVGKGVGA